MKRFLMLVVLTNAIINCYGTGNPIFSHMVIENSKSKEMYDSYKKMKQSSRFIFYNQSASAFSRLIPVGMTCYFMRGFLQNESLNLQIKRFVGTLFSWSFFNARAQEFDKQSFNYKEKNREISKSMQELRLQIDPTAKRTAKNELEYWTEKDWDNQIDKFIGWDTIAKSLDGCII